MSLQSSSSSNVVVYTVCSHCILQASLVQVILYLRVLLYIFISFICSCITCMKLIGHDCNKSSACFYIDNFAQFTLHAYWLVLCIPRSNNAPACQVALSNVLRATNRNADSIASSALTKQNCYPERRSHGLVSLVVHSEVLHESEDRQFC